MKSEKFRSPLEKALFLIGAVLGAMAKRNDEVKRRIHFLLPFGGNVTNSRDLKRTIAEIPLLAGRFFSPGEAGKFMDVLKDATDTILTVGLPPKLSADEKLALSKGYCDGANSL
jgi:hypothetical protein